MATAKFGEYTYNVDSKGIPYGNPLPSGTAVTTTAPQWQQPTQAEAIANVTQNTPAAYRDQVLAQVNANPQAYKPTQTITPTDVTTPTPTIPTTPTDTTDYSSILGSLTPGDNAQQLIDKSAQSQNDLFKQMTDLIGTPPSQADAYKEAQNQAGIVEKQKVVSDLTAQLNGITANSQAGQLTQEGKAIPLGIIGGRQAEIAREAAIKALPVSAQLQAAQGNLQMAQENLNTMFELKSADATAQYNYKTQLVQSIYSLASDQEKTKLDYVLSLEERKYNEQQTNQQAIQEIALSVAGSAPASVLSAIFKSTDISSAAQAAGPYLASTSSSSDPMSYKEWTLAGSPGTYADWLTKNSSSSNGTEGERQSAAYGTINQILALPTTQGYVDTNGFITSQGFKDLINAAREDNISRKDFLDQYSYLLYPKGATQYGLTAKEQSDYGITTK